jgi:PD-(D/E)XK nuclease superfamily protein
MSETQPNWIRCLDDGRHAVYLDNLLLSVYVECERKFKYRHIDNLIEKGSTGRTASQWLGIWWASVMENFYRGMMDYQHKVPGSVEPSEARIVQAAAGAWTLQCMSDGDFGSNNEDTFQTRYTKVYDKFGGAEGAVRMALDYWHHFGESDAKDWRIIASELAFGLNGEVMIHEDNEMVLYWCGKPDLVIYETTLDNLVPVDTKTEEYLKSNFIQKWKPHGQTAGYVVALNVLAEGLGFHRTVDRCIINGAARMLVEKPRDGKPRPRFLRPRITYNPAELAEWKHNTFAKAKRLLHSYKTGEWIRADAHICHLYSGCPYRGLDNQPPGVPRNAVLETSYVQIEPWIPYQKFSEEEEAIA